MRRVLQGLFMGFISINWSCSEDAVRLKENDLELEGLRLIALDRDLGLLSVISGNGEELYSLSLDDDFSNAGFVVCGENYFSVFSGQAFRVYDFEYKFVREVSLRDDALLGPDVQYSSYMAGWNGDVLGAFFENGDAPKRRGPIFGIEENLFFKYNVLSGSFGFEVVEALVLRNWAIIADSSINSEYRVRFINNRGFGASPLSGFQEAAKRFPGGNSNFSYYIGADESVLFSGKDRKVIRNDLRWRKFRGEGRPGFDAEKSTWYFFKKNGDLLAVGPNFEESVFELNSDWIEDVYFSEVLHITENGVIIVALHGPRVRIVAIDSKRMGFSIIYSYFRNSITGRLRSVCVIEEKDRKKEKAE